MFFDGKRSNLIFSSPGSGIKPHLASLAFSLHLFAEIIVLGEFLGYKGGDHVATRLQATVLAST
jgi:hypothetical protein